MQALRQRQPVEHDDDGTPTENSDQRAECRLLREHREHVLPGAIPDGEKLDQDDRQQHGERIVAAGFDLEGRADARAQPQPAGMDQKEYRCGVGRGDDRADQQRLGPGHAEQKFRHRSRQRRRHQDANGRQRDRRRQHAAERGEAGAQAAIEQNERERDRADHIGRVHVVELNAAWTALAREHANDQEHEQQRGSEAHGHQARHDAGQHQERAEQNANADCVESGHVCESLAPIGNGHAPRGNC